MRRYFAFLFSALAIVGTGMSCQTERPSVPEGEKYTVSLNIDGDFDLSVDQNPLTKATPVDAYGINVYYDKEGDGVTDNIYAYGLFDNVPDMTITLLSNHKY